MAHTEPITSSERWLQIGGCEGYDVSDRGRIRSYHKRGRRRGLLATPVILEPVVSGKGYLSIILCRLDGSRRRDYVHRLVLETFVGPCPAGLECRHLDGNPKNNRLGNLRWGTKDENTDDRFRHGTLVPRIDPEEPAPILFDDPFVPWEAVIPWESWKEIRRCPGYEVSNRGRLVTMWGRGGSRERWKKRQMSHRRQLLNPSIGNHGYLTTTIRDADGHRYSFTVHRAVIEAFSPQTRPDYHCRHVDGNPLNNHISNLKWGSVTENMRDRNLHGTDNRGSKHGMSKLTEDNVLAIRSRQGKKSQGDTAEEFGVSRATVSVIWRRHTWKHI